MVRGGGGTGQRAGWGEGPDPRGPEPKTRLQWVMSGGVSRAEQGRALGERRCGERGGGPRRSPRTCTREPATLDLPRAGRISLCVGSCWCRGWAWSPCHPGSHTIVSPPRDRLDWTRGDQSRAGAQGRVGGCHPLRLRRRRVRAGLLAGVGRRVWTLTLGHLPADHGPGLGVRLGGLSPDGLLQTGAGAGGVLPGASGAD